MLSMGKILIDGQPVAVCASTRHSPRPQPAALPPFPLGMGAATTAHCTAQAAIYVNHNLRFLKPVFVGDTVDVIATIREVDTERKRVYFDTICTINGERVIEGDAQLYVPAPSESGQLALDAANIQI